MARTLLNTQIPTSSGLTPAYTAVQAAPSHQFYNDGKSILHVKNGGAGALTITLITPNAPDGNAIADKTVSVAAGAEVMISNLAPSLYNQPDNSVDAGQVYCDFSPITSVTCAIYHA